MKCPVYRPLQLDRGLPEFLRKYLVAASANTAAASANTRWSVLTTR
jgi:hypothetical protein